MRTVTLSDRMIRAMDYRRLVVANASRPAAEELLAAGEIDETRRKVAEVPCEGPEGRA